MLCRPGTAVAGRRAAFVVLWPVNPPLSLSAQGSVSAQTNSKGVYILASIPPGTYHVEALQSVSNAIAPTIEIKPNIPFTLRPLIVDTEQAIWKIK